MVPEVRRCLNHAPCVARGANTPAFAGIGDDIVVAATVKPCAGKAVRKDATFQIFAKGLARIGLGRVVLALPVELARAGKCMPSLEVFGNRLVEKP
jgi:hypothetical protein